MFSIVGCHPEGLWGDCIALMTGTHRGSFWTAASQMISDGLVLAVTAGVLGWLIHAVAVMCGVRLTRQSDDSQMADYTESESKLSDKSKEAAQTSPTKSEEHEWP